MKKKYFIFALTFLCLFFSQLGYGQDLVENTDGGVIVHDYDGSIMQLAKQTSAEGIELLEVIITGNPTTGGGWSLEDLVRFYMQDHPDYSMPPEDPQVTLGLCDYFPILCDDFTGPYNEVTDTPCTITSCPAGYTLTNCECVKDCPITSCPPGYTLIDCECTCQNKTMAAIANHVYNTLNGIQEPDEDKLNAEGIKIIPPSELPTDVSNRITWTDPSSSFNSTLYRVDHGNGDIEYVYATEGTVSLKDWKTDFEQGLGYATDQYKTSVKNAVELATWAHDQGFKLSFTGHSLGGGLANANALATGLPATIYNPAGLHDNTVYDPDLRLNLDNSKNVTAYVVRGEPVDIVNNHIAFTPVRGTTNYIGSGIGAVAEYLLADFFAGTIGDIAAAYDLHRMDTVLSNLDCN